MTLTPDATLDADRYAFVRKFLAETPKPPGGGVLFDIGAGPMPMKAAVEAEGYRWYGFDLHPKAPEVTPWDFNTPFVGDLRADVVLLMDVIEHTFNPGFAIRNIVNAMKPDGRLVMTMPNPRWSRARTLHLFSGEVACFTEHDLDSNHHVFATWPHIVLKLVSDAGLKVEQYVTLDGAEGRSSSFNPARAAEGLVRWAIEARDPSARGMSYAFVARPEAIL